MSKRRVKAATARVKLRRKEPIDCMNNCRLLGLQHFLAGPSPIHHLVWRDHHEP